MDPGLVAEAAAGARAAATAAGVEIRLLHGAEEMAAAAAAMAAVWGRETDRPPMDPGLLVALGHSGNYVSGAFAGARLVGTCAGWFHPPAQRSLHSHIAGILPEVAGRGIGRALKLHQRAWGLEHGVRTITWTFDPLVARNAYINLTLLGADLVEYLPDLYGPMTDGLNAGQASDRLLVSWDLAAATPRSDDPPRGAPAALVLADGRPLPALDALARARECTVAVPSDIEALRRTDPGLATAWRTAQRAVFTGLLASGWSVTGFSRVAGFRLRLHHELPGHPVPEHDQSDQGE
ncbi:MAG: GNAT family N-acetyltransferase [Propionicimonas sp.]|nr:GNAT family N-acetyltransferase [Propionicimonas sp.]